MELSIISLVIGVVAFVIGLATLCYPKHWVCISSFVIFLISMVIFGIEVNSTLLTNVDVHPVSVEGVIPNYSTAGTKVQVRGDEDTIISEYTISYYAELISIGDPGTVVTYYHKSGLTHSIWTNTFFYPYAYDSEEMQKILNSYEITIK